MIRKSTILVIATFLLNFLNANAVDLKNFSDDKAVFGDIGIGSPGLSIGVGFRYWVVGASVSLAGLFNSVPQYSYYTNTSQGPKILPNEPLPDGYRADSYTTSMVSFDLNFYYEYFLPFTITGIVGYYQQTDTVLAYNIESKTRYRYREEISSGIGFGLGLEYQINEMISAGVLFHSKRGLLVRMSYFLY